MCLFVRCRSIPCGILHAPSFAVKCSEYEQNLCNVQIRHRCVGGAGCDFCIPSAENSNGGIKSKSATYNR